MNGARWLFVATVCRSLVLPLVLAASLLVSSPALARSQVVYSGNSQCRDIALTYDTEFTATTQTLIDTIDDLGIKTTWFFLGDSVRAYRAIVQQVAARHQVGNHTYSHPEMTGLTDRDMQRQIVLAHDRIIEAAGQDPRPIWRPPYGNWNGTVAAAADAEGYPYTVMWSVDTRDWAGPSAETIHQRIVGGAFPGAIVLMHGSPSATPEATRLAVPQLRARGYQFVTVTEILGIDRHLRDFGGDTYLVQPGDQVEQVARCHNLTGPRLMAFNEVHELWAGWKLQIPHTDEIIVRVDGERVAFDTYPRLVGARSLAPVRLAEQLGATVDWDGSKVILHHQGRRIELTPGQQLASVDGQPVDMLAPAVKVGERVLVPVRFLADQLGVGIAWDGVTYTVSITRQPVDPSVALPAGQAPEPASPAPASPAPAPGQ
jgi:peptidoglycan/xylan/chitin deacetylase (PgdA/CDA1 family)